MSFLEPEKPKKPSPSLIGTPEDIVSSWERTLGLPENSIPRPPKQKTLAEAMLEYAKPSHGSLGGEATPAISAQPTSMEEFPQDDEAPLVKEIRRVGEIQKRLLEEEYTRRMAQHERRSKKWYWNTWWRAEFWFKDLFRHKAAGSKSPKPAETPREKVKGTEVIAILIAFVALPVAMNTNDPLTAYAAYAVAWFVLMYLCFSHHANAIWRVMASIAISLLLGFFSYRYWATHKETTAAIIETLTEKRKSEPGIATPLPETPPIESAQSVVFQQVGLGDTSPFAINNHVDGMMDYVKRGPDNSYIVGIHANTGYVLGEDQRLELRVAGKFITGFHLTDSVIFLTVTESKDGDDFCITVDPMSGIGTHFEVISSEPESIVVRYKLSKSTKGQFLPTLPPVLQDFHK